MQKIIKYTFLSAMMATLGLQGCKDSYFDKLSDNPNQVTAPSLNALLATSTYKAGFNNYSVASIILPYVQYTANPAANGAGDTFQAIDFSATWDLLYFAMADANEMKKLAVTQNSSEYKGVADVLIAYNLMMVNDLWGDAPFSEAFNINNLVPKYDKQQDVYASTLALVDEAITELSKTNSAIKLAAASDLIYGTNVSTERANWLKMAYALKARLLNKVSKSGTYNPAAVLDAVSKSFTGNDDDARMQTFRERSPWATVALNNEQQSLGGWLSEQLIDALNGTTYGVFDPRLPKITDLTVDGKYIGTVNGAGNRAPGANTRKDENYISRNSPWSGNTSPIFIVTYAELKFIEAEAALNIDRARSYAAYLAAIRANMDKFQVSATDKEAYMAQPTVAVGAAALTKSLIFKEKYIATYLNPEAWNDARRFDYQYKDFTMPVNAALPTFIRRLDYPQGERSKNGANVPIDVPRTSRLWWDQ
ncbi:MULTISPECIES: SusD/RagB family nutrient-binding outer membrane lipoprotein [unclassified Pedobacter]|uniref:SusD/RagB family nutrient-binding outer membrane lipoprotein n=1 Tax=unclassified Pedobacter TaxID=2628915 RepID=UPI002247C0D6|nr:MULTISPECIES: SusD/RagB family nutrient-binding outer membrane lipoprotein [unclassified Pedobacter]MCX2432548.1 SusD/RagB family nutrient-binding outer membrane lipoprotein [Pedobacter sp. GR22-10]MCX2583363.1 SusD/RagB family nutrient-binding outer membrane lipoprotein [Pedobacter sp. MR22-3]